ncbi:MAG TPA: retropepsin-like aspartic protease [Pyrinomonadaceae bacterium]|nr:retropepsin-like aspartic protease [Pyrinomonadaceae bacterium]
MTFKQIIGKLALAVGLMLLFFSGPGRGQSQSVKPVAEVPFEFIRNQIVVQVKMAGKGPFNMLFDTNTDPSAIDLATARELGLKLGSKGYQGTGGGTEINLVYPTKVPFVELGSVIAKEVFAAAINLTKLSAKLGKPIHGVLGYSFLRDRIFQIDYPASKIRFYAVSPYPGIQNSPNTVNRNVVAFRYENDVLVDSVFVNGQKMRATLDTGGSNTFALTPEAITMLGLEEEARNAKAELAAGYNGEFESKTGFLKSVRIGRLSVDSPTVSFWSAGTGHDKKKYQLSIGNGFFKDYLVTFDFRSKIVVFERVE